MEQGLRLRALYRSLGWKRSECAQFFHVSARTLHNWESGITAIPYAALKLLRIHARYELPGQEWNGWVFHSGKLWSPEGHGFSPGEASCWHNLCRRAHLFGVLLKENDQLRHKLRSEAVQRHQALQAPVAPLAQRAEGALLARGRLPRAQRRVRYAVAVSWALAILSGMNTFIWIAQRLGLVHLSLDAPRSGSLTPSVAREHGENKKRCQSNIE